MFAARGEVDAIHARFALGILLLQDLAVIPLLLIVTSLVTGTGVTEILLTTAEGFLAILGFAVAFFLFNRYALPYIIGIGFSLLFTETAFL